VQLVDDRRRRAGRRHEAEPCSCRSRCRRIP
jgi:hypothetical protein